MRGEALFRNVDYRVARTKEEKEAIYALRYRAYLKAGYIPASDEERVTDRFDDTPNSWVFGVYIEEILRGSIRLHLLTQDCRASIDAELFGDILNPRLDRGEVFIDAARFVGDPDFEMIELPYVIMRLGFAMCERFGADTGICAVSTDHVKFHKRFFQYKPITEPRAFPGVFRKTVLLEANFKIDGEEVLQRFPIMRSSAFERRMLFGVGEPVAIAA